jgi:hypothetical protein
MVFSFGILRTEKKGQLSNALERFHTSSFSKQKLHMNGTISDINDHIYDVILQTHSPYGRILSNPTIPFGHSVTLEPATSLTYSSTRSKSKSYNKK